jgi:putative transposase
VDVTAVNQCWAMDFMSDALFNGRRFRTLTMLDVYSRECLNIYADNRITGDTVVDILDSIGYHRGLPDRIRVDNVLSLKSIFYLDKTTVFFKPSVFHYLEG